MMKQLSFKSVKKKKHFTLAPHNGNSSTTCELNEIMCISDGRCLEGYKFCNGIIDCDDGSDEELCSGFCTIYFSLILNLVL